MAHDIFISYSHKDKPVADAICAHIEQEGLRCWYAPRDIVPGASWANSIIEAINSTKIMVLVFTDYSNVSSQVLREVSNAVSAGVTIIPFRLTESEPAGDMQYYLSVVHWLDAMNGELENSIENLASLCKAIVNSEEGDPSAVEKAAAKAESERLQRQKEREEVQRTAARKKKRLIIICAAAAVVLAVILGIVFGGGSDGESTQAESPDTETTQAQGAVPAVSDVAVSDPSESYTQGNSQSCLQWGGYIAKDDDWYYYSSNKGGALYKMKADGSDQQKLTDEAAKQIHVIDGYVYYQCSKEGNTGPCIKRIKTDGSDEKVLHNGMIEDMKIFNDRIYYKDQMDSLHLHSIDMDGTDEVVENTLDDIYDYCTDGKYLYYSNGQDGRKIYRAEINGGSSICIVDHEVNGMTIAGDKLYYNDSINNYLCAYDLTKGESTELAMEYLGYINVTADGIYGYCGSQNMYLCSLQLNGLGLKILAEDDATEICVCGEKIYYYCDSDDTYYIVDLDGSNKMTP